MRDPDEFDAFYRETRERLLLQTYALTGDLPAARSAVRDAYVVAWHHWRKAAQDPEAYTRPLAWAQAQRRHTARIWHREKGLDPEVRATLEALGKLTVDQRRILLLTVLATGTMDDFAREVGLTREDAERELQTATAQLAILRGVPAPLVRTLFTPMAQVVAEVRLPRATILRRAGAARRRTHTTVGAVAAVAALVASGFAVTDPAGVRASLDREGLAAASGGGPRPRATKPAPPPEPVLEDEQLLQPAQVEALGKGRWQLLETHDNTAGDGLVLPCQRNRYADPEGTMGLVRVYRNDSTKQQRIRSALQLAESSEDERRARKGYRAARDWFAGCADDRAQLLTTRRVDGVGDEATLLVLRDWDAPVTTLVAGVARSGALVTSTVTSTRGTGLPDLKAPTRLLAAAVDGLCTLPDAGECSSGRPKSVPVRPLPVGDAPAMLAEVDLPPVAGVPKPWVGTAAQKAVQNFAATRCDETEFRGEGWSDNLTRTFLVPGAKLPPQFGLTQTVGALPAKRVGPFVQGVRDRMAECPDEDLGTDVEQVADLRRGRSELVAWRVTTEISDESSVTFLMALARTGTAVSQLGFVPSGEVTLGDEAFLQLAERALERLHELPPAAR